MTAPLILATNSIKDSGYNVNNSVRFEHDNTSKLLRINSGTATNEKKGTFSGWWKMQTQGNSSGLGLYMSKADADGVERFLFSLATNNRINGGFRGAGGSPDIDFGTSTSNAIFRDPSAWYHIVVNYDTTDSTAANRLKLFVNNVQQTLTFTSDIPQDTVFPTSKNGKDIEIGFTQDNGDGYQNGNRGYLCEMAFVDGQQLAPTEFGEYDSNSPNVWIPKDISGITFGSFGFYYEFKNSGSLGADSSGNGNNASTVNQLDQCTDTCTNNFAVINVADNFFASSTIREGGTKVTTGSSAEAMNTSTFAMTKGKWYMEVDNISGSGAKICGITPTPSFQTSSHGKSGDVTPHTVCYLESGAVQEGNGSGGQTTLATYASYSNGNIIGIYMDLDNMKAYFSKDGSLQSSTGIDLEPLASNGTGHYMFFVGDNNAGSRVCEANFGNPHQSLSSTETDDNGHGAFEHSPNITGDGEAKKFFACCSKNLAEFG